MKFSCEKLLLQNAVNTTSRAVAAKSSIPALEGLLLQCGDGVLTVSGYNMQTGIRTRFPVEEQEGGETDEDTVLMAVLDAGAEEVNDLDGSFEVISEATDLVAVRTALQEAGLDYESADAAFVPTMTVDVDVEAATKILRLIDALEDCDDVQNVFSNFDATDEVMAQVE